MFDEIDPRWGDDARERDDTREVSRGSRGVSDPRDRDRDLDDPRDVFMRELDLPRGLERERVHVHVHAHGHDQYYLRGSETRTLSIVGAFRVVPAVDLRDAVDRPSDPRSSDLRHLRESGLIRTVPLGRASHAVVLSDRGRDVLETHRRRDRGHEVRQRFYSGLNKPRELVHDSQVYRAYLRAAERLQEREARIQRVVLDYEIKREYQRFLQERNRGRADADGRPDRTRDEIRDWAFDHNLPYENGHVRLPDARIEYLDREGRERTEDIEVTTGHYRGAHGAGKANFSCYRGSGVRIGGGNGPRGGRGSDPDLAGEFL